MHVIGKSEHSRKREKVGNTVQTGISTLEGGIQKFKEKE